MGVCIVSSGLSDPDDHLGALAHAARAGLAAVDASAARIDQIDLMINTGVYRDDNMCEPAMAAVIQHEMGMCLDPRRFPVERPTFSFDLLNGAAGPMDALQVVGAWFGGRGAGRAMIVTSDAHPSGSPRDDFPITAMGAAVVVEDVADCGFIATAHVSDQGVGDGQQGYCDIGAHREASRHEIVVERDDDFAERLLEITADALDSFLEEHAVDRDAVHLLCSQPLEGFAAALADEVGLTKVPIDVHGRYGDVHTSALFAAYHHAHEEGVFASGDLSVWVGSGAGFAVGCGLYRHP